MVPIIGLLFAVASAGQIGSGDRLPDLLTGPRFHQELNQVTTGSWENVELRTLLDKLSSQRRVAILLDRRIDPTVKIPVDLVDHSLKDSLQEIAQRVGADVSVPENVVYVGPSSAASVLRTVIELRTSELAASTIPERRRTELRRRHTVTWQDLDSPADILKQITDHYHLTIQHPEFVPHDLWGGCWLPEATAAEALSLVLIQFDLTFAWQNGGQGIELVPLPQQVTVARRSRPKGRSMVDVQKLVGELLPEVNARVDGSDLVVQGTVEQHEAVAALFSQSGSKPPPKPPKLGGLKQRVFAEIKFKRVPVRAVMKKLEESGVTFSYDAAKLEAAGIDLDQPIDLEVDKATADEFFQALFTPLKLSFEIDNLTVKLNPKK